MASISSTQVSVVATAGGTPLMTLDKVRTAVQLVNQDASASANIGDTTVSTSSFELKAGAGLSFNAPPNFQLYARSASGTVRVDVLEIET